MSATEIQVDDVETFEVESEPETPEETLQSQIEKMKAKLAAAESKLAALENPEMKALKDRRAVVNKELGIAARTRVLIANGLETKRRAVVAAEATLAEREATYARLKAEQDALDAQIEALS